MRIGNFIVGSAVTKAVQLESKGKGARLFIDQDLPSQCSSHWHAEFCPRTSPIDFQTTDEFRWYNNSEPMVNSHKPKTEKCLTDSISLIAKLRFSPMFGWNARSQAGKLHVAATVDTIGNSILEEYESSDFLLRCELLMDEESMTDRSDRKVGSYLKAQGPAISVLGLPLSLIHI